MKKILFILLLFFLSRATYAQKIDSISFNLYTDSLKKGFYNYINVDGKLSNGSWIPLTSKDISLTSNAGKFRDNDLFIDSSYTADTVIVKATLLSNPSVSKEIVIYIRKRPFTERLKTNEEILNGIQQERRRPRQHE